MNRLGRKPNNPTRPFQVHWPWPGDFLWECISARTSGTRHLGDFYDASGLGLILVTYDSFDAVSVPALVDSVAIGE